MPLNMTNSFLIHNTHNVLMVTVAYFVGGLFVNHYRTLQVLADTLTSNLINDTLLSDWHFGPKRKRIYLT